MHFEIFLIALSTMWILNAIVEKAISSRRVPRPFTIRGIRAETYRKLLRSACE